MAFAIDLAKEGFNICIISRSQTKLDDAEKKILASAKGVKTMTISADLGAMTKIAEYTELTSKIAHLDIGVLITNAGTVNMGPFRDITPEDIQMVMNLDALHPLYLARTLMPQMQQRSKRSALIFTGSGFACTPMTGVVMYAASKIFCRYIYQGWNYDHANKFDVLCVEPGEVKTLLNPRGSV